MGTVAAGPVGNFRSMSENIRSNKLVTRLISAIFFAAGVFALWLVVTQVVTFQSRRSALLSTRASLPCEASDCNREALQADLRAAAAAEDVVDLAVWQFIAGLIGIYFVARTLEATRAAVKEANEATIAARAALKISEETSRRELRPYVFVEQFRWNWIHDKDDENIVVAWTLIITWRNSGQTPAQRVRAAGGIALIEGDLPEDFTYPDSPGRDSIVGALGPGQLVESSFEVSLASLQAVRRGQANLHYWAWCDYDDGFVGTPRRRTEKHARALVLRDPSGTNCIFSERIELGFNGSDEYCYRAPLPF